MKKPYIFFDFDGTVLNTNEIIIDSWNATAMHYLGHQMTEEEILKSFGEPIRYTAGVWFPDVDVEESIIYYRDYQNAHCDGKVKIFDGMMEVIDELRERGYRVSLVTSRMKPTTFAYLEEFGLTDKFDVIITNDDTNAHKPDPEPLNIAVHKMEEIVGRSISPDECLMVGDTRFDIGCGANAGVETVMVEWAHPIDEDGLKEMGVEPTYRIAKPEDLMDIV